MSLVIAMCGHTAAGKTSMAKHVASMLSLKYIGEAEIKRRLRPNYSTDDSLDENLRNKAYQIAIDEVGTHLYLADNVLIDASFHRRFRREWLYNQLIDCSASLVWLKCCCSYMGEVQRRIAIRHLSAVKCADNHADSMEIYKYISKTFEPLSFEEIPKKLDFTIISIDTWSNKIYETEAATITKNEQHMLVKSTIHDYLVKMRKICQY